MKFILNGNEMVLQSKIPNPLPPHEQILHDLVGGANWITEKAVTGFFDLVGEGIKVLWDLFVAYLPDILGYGAIATGVFIILGAMLGKGGMIKPLAVYSGLLIFGLCVLGAS